ncbi:hypothetical protein BJ508DRAFT_330422 [Ascobolus immersus RN42]|uniref:Uncharacterized protein n=1 Tax=Ascobolus immersus RN42 TaxID=1160509 RepID=A0A3N4HVV9_ASCIM|nr:hypothetical protein BJ508DRAFT_330422 [Ascobolus immersus RN42]
MLSTSALSLVVSIKDDQCEICDKILAMVPEQRIGAHTESCESLLRKFPEPAKILASQIEDWQFTKYAKDVGQYVEEAKKMKLDPEKHFQSINRLLYGDMFCCTGALSEEDARARPCGFDVQDLPLCYSSKKVPCNSDAFRKFEHQNKTLPKVEKHGYLAVVRTA